ncbi:glycosyltransferase family 9 protein [Aliiglaciecola sp. 3_MG-2023]|uniref:glycosyltransferase family 9 protein n=1 Tax=Aliiglaciecola sp. 3_MG-2023 TaxID=3062644 RepID=UPI0026E440DA|nr:glycosyltransferase family 9 protein [Aliiglaciecola sp. 3_MG-2023]MDO6693013.1 glycosyltransferase family 9 protein [Aliiglaciecola sp. 3_MG-2023]
MNVQKLCLLRLSAIGDVCHAVAMVDRIVKHAPNIQITWIIGKVEYQLLKDMPNVRFIIFDKKMGKEAYSKLKDDLNGEKFDALFLMQVAFRANWAARLINAKTKIGFDWARSKELHWLFANQRIAPQQHAHVLEGFMGFADSIGVPATNQLSWSIPMSADEQAMAQDLHAELKSYAVISPAASKAERNWLPERYAAIADYLTQKGMQVVLCGGPADLDKSLGEQITSHCQHKVTNLIGKTSLKQMLAVLKYANLVVAPDTGPAHMATAVGTQVIGLYAHSNPRRTGPYSSLQYVVSVYDEMILQQTGKTWQQLPWGTRAKGQDLMKFIEVERVKAKVDELLSLQG